MTSKIPVTHLKFPKVPKITFPKSLSSSSSSSKTSSKISVSKIHPTTSMSSKHISVHKGAAKPSGASKPTQTKTNTDLVMKDWSQGSAMSKLHGVHSQYRVHKFSIKKAFD